MGSFDSVMVGCPKCGRMIEFQSKAGKCELREFEHDNVPATIAEDIDKEVEVCPVCAASVQIQLVDPIPRVRMRVFIVDPSCMDDD